MLGTIREDYDAKFEEVKTRIPQPVEIEDEVSEHQSGRLGVPAG